MIEVIKQNKIGAGARKTRIFKAVAGDSTVSQHISSNSKCRAGKYSSIKKTLVFKGDVNKSSRHSSSWKDKSLLRKLAKIDFKQYFVIHRGTFSTKYSKFYKNEQEANCSCGFGIKGVVQERGNKSEQLIPCGEKRRKLHSPVINLKMLNQFIPSLHFKMKAFLS